MPPPPSKRSPAVVRGGKDAENDPERLQGTQAKIKVPPVARGGGDAEADPEVSKHTQAKVKIPSAARPAVSRGGGMVDDDPERSHNTQAKIKAQPGKRKGSNWEAPPGKMSRELEKPSGPEYETGSAYASLDEEDGAADYQTGNDYEPLQQGKELNLEGDGLDALDADLGPPKTKALEVLLAEDSGAEQDEGNEENETRAGPPLSLQITAGPDQGKKKKFKGVRMVIGRTPGVDLQLSDQSVSRRHVELVQGDKGVLLRDLGSGNGTKVNGEKIAEKILEHGDEIHIGKTKLKFVDEMAAFKKLRDDQQKEKEEEKKEEEEAAAPASSGDSEAATEGVEAKAAEGEAPAEGEEAGPKTIARPAIDRSDRKPIARREAEAKGVAGLVQKFKALDRTKRLLVLGGAAFFMLFLIALVSVSRPPPPPAVDPRAKAAAEKMQLARDAVRAANYEEAIVLIEAAERLQPGIDQSKLAAKVRGELAVQKSLEGVKQMIEQSRFDDARSELARVPQGSVKTDEQKKAIEEQLKLAEAKFKRQKISDLLAAGEIEAAKQLMVELPDSDQREVAAQIAEAEAAAEEQAKEAKRQEKLAIGQKIAGKQAAAAEHMALAFAVVQRKFAGNEWQRASAECDRVIDQNPGDDAIRRRAKLLQQLIPNFGRTYEEGTKKFREGQIASAAKPLRQARSFYGQIDLPTPLGPEIDEKLAQAAVMAGREALLRDDLASAAVNFRDAVKLDPNDGRGRSGLDDVISKAEDLYQSAYMIRDRDPREALKKFKVVVEVTPAGSVTHEKAKNQIAAMNP